MAAYFCGSGGSDANNGTTWALRKATFAGAIAAMTANGDIIAVDAAAPPADIAADTTWTFTFNCSVIASTNSGTATITPTTMGATTYLGAGGATSYAITLAGAFKVYFYGITFRIAGSTNKSISVNTGDGGHFELESCYLWLGTTTASAARINIGSSSSNINNYTALKNCTYRFGNAAHFLGTTNKVEFFGGSISSAGTAPTTLITDSSNIREITFTGVDLSHVTGTLVSGTSTSSVPTYRFIQCKLGTGVTPMAAQTPANKSSVQVWLHDCSDGDTHGMFQYHDAFGKIVSNTTIKYTSGAAAQSWEIDTTANCSFSTPFVTPWISFYNTGTSAVTPRIEVLRDGSATAYKDSEVWGEFSVKDNAGFTNPAFYNDRQALVDWAAGTAGASQASGTDTWDGENATHWAGKVDSGVAVTPDEAGHIRGRVVIGLASVSDLFVDPQIRM
jgi:hypothetical protein